MRFQTFLPLLTYPEPSAQTSISSAVALARWLEADLHVQALEADIPNVSNALSKILMNLPQMIQDAEKHSARRGAELLDAAQVEARAAGLSIITSIAKSGPALIGDKAAEQARYFDLSLLGWSSDNDGTSMLAEAVLFGSGRPAILLPDGHASAQYGHIAIAWDGSRVAARALADARRLLERSSAVEVITVTDEKPLQAERSGEHLSENLRHSGLAATFTHLEAKGRHIAETLQGEALERGAQLLVLGAYGHSRMRDFVLGGATQGVLADLKLPVLLSH